MQNYGHFYLIIYFFLILLCIVYYSNCCLKNLLPIEVLFTKIFTFEIHYIQQLRILLYMKLFCPRRDWSFDEHVKRFVLTCWKALTNFILFLYTYFNDGHFWLYGWSFWILTKSCRSFGEISNSIFYIKLFTLFMINKFYKILLSSNYNINLH